MSLKLAVLTALLWSLSALAQEAPSGPVAPATSVRNEKKIGLIATYNTSTQLVGPAVAVNPVDWFRLEAGFVVPSTSPHKYASTLQSTAKFMVSGWDTSPYAGIGSGPGHSQLAAVVGVDHTTSGGFNVGAGYSKVSSSGASGITVYGGYYF